MKKLETFVGNIVAISVITFLFISSAAHAVSYSTSFKTNLSGYQEIEFPYGDGWENDLTEKMVLQNQKTCNDLAAPITEKANSFIKESNLPFDVLAITPHLEYFDLDMYSLRLVPSEFSPNCEETKTALNQYYAYCDNDDRTFCRINVSSKSLNVLVEKQTIHSFILPARGKKWADKAQARCNEEASVIMQQNEVLKILNSDISGTEGNKIACNITFISVQAR